MRKLSSKLTWFWKIFGFLFLVGSVDQIVDSILCNSTLYLDFFCRRDSAERTLEHSIFRSIVAVACIFYSIQLIRLKNILLEDDEFIIKNIFETIRIKVSDVEKISGTIFIIPDLAWLHLKEKSKFGNKIIFAPPNRAFLSKPYLHPMVYELSEMVNSDDSPELN